MTPLRILLFSPQATAMERLLMADSRYHVLDAVDGETDVYARLAKAAPDIAVLDDHLPGFNALHLLRRLQKTLAAPPYTVYIGEDTKEALFLGADAAFKSLKNIADLLPVLEKVPASPLAGLAQQAVILAQSHTRDILRALSFPAHLKGTAYLQYVLPLLASNPSPERMLGKPVYGLIADHFSTTPAAAERALRTAIENTWLTGNLTSISELFGYTVNPEKGKPTNHECLALLARHVQAKTQNSLLSAR